MYFLYVSTATAQGNVHKRGSSPWLNCFEEQNVSFTQRLKFSGVLFSMSDRPLKQLRANAIPATATNGRHATRAAGPIPPLGSGASGAGTPATPAGSGSAQRKGGSGSSGRSSDKTAAVSQYRAAHLDQVQMLNANLLTLTGQMIADREARATQHQELMSLATENAQDAMQLLRDIRDNGGIGAAPQATAEESFNIAERAKLIHVSHRLLSFVSHFISFESNWTCHVLLFSFFSSRSTLSS